MCVTAIEAVASGLIGGVSLLPQTSRLVDTVESEYANRSAIQSYLR